MTRLHLPQAIEVRLHMRKINVVILTPKQCSSRSLSLSVGFSIQDAAMDIDRSAAQGDHYHVDVIYLLPYLGIKKGARALWYSKLSLHQLGS